MVLINTLCYNILVYIAVIANPVLLHPVTGLPVDPKATGGALRAPSDVENDAAYHGRPFRFALYDPSTGAGESLNGVKAEKDGWLNYYDIMDHGWHGVRESQPVHFRTDAFEKLKVPPYLEDDVTSLTSGSLGQWTHVEWQMDGKGALNGEGTYTAAYSAQYGIMISTEKEDPWVLHSGGLRYEDDWPDVTFLTYQDICRARALRNEVQKPLGEILVVLKTSGPAMTLVNDMYPPQLHGHAIRLANAITLKLDSRISTRNFDAILGTREGRAIATMLLRRRAQLGHLVISSVKIWWPKVNEPCLLFSITSFSSVSSRGPSGEMQNSSMGGNTGVMREINVDPIVRDFGA